MTFKKLLRFDKIIIYIGHLCWNFLTNVLLEYTPEERVGKRWSCWFGNIPIFQKPPQVNLINTQLFIEINTTAMNRGATVFISTYRKENSVVHSLNESLIRTLLEMFGLQKVSQLIFEIEVLSAYKYSLRLERSLPNNFQFKPWL